MDAATLMHLERCPNIWTLTWDEEPLLCGGTIEQWPGRHIAFAYLNKTTGSHMIFTTKEAVRLLNNAKGRLEFTVRKDFEKGHRWARLLGFTVETPLMRAFGPEGEDHVGYVKFNK
jgi:hypothetical protein